MSWEYRIMEERSDNQVIMFHSPDGNIAMEILHENNNTWHSQKKIDGKIEKLEKQLNKKEK